MALQTFLLYLATWSLVAISPGPAVMYSMSCATRFGFRSALMGILGVQLGHFIFFGCVAGGLAALLSTASTAFAVLRFAGALYLCCLGLRILAATFRQNTATVKASAPAPARTSLLLQGFAIQVTNPKALLFMSALLPQFIQARQPLALQLSILLAVTIAVDIIVLSTYAWLAMRGTQSIRATGLTRWLERTFGAALIFFGIRLLASRK